jgi:hypothetical protein
LGTPASLRRSSAGLDRSPRKADLPASLNGSRLRPALPSAGRASPHASSPRNCQRYGNMNPFPISYAFQPRLRGRLTLGRLPLPRKPWVFGERVFHPSFRYSCLHPLFRPLQQTSSAHLRRDTECSPTPSTLFACSAAASVPSLSPVTLSAHDYSTSELLRTLSRYGCF